nr:hypothetical protein [Tanacetum cinerariifolium]
MSSEQPTSSFLKSNPQPPQTTPGWSGVIMQKGFLGSSRGGGNHKKKEGSKAKYDSTSQLAKLDDLAFPKLSDLVAKKQSNHGDLAIENVHGVNANVVISLGSGTVSSLEEPDLLGPSINAHVAEKSSAALKYILDNNSIEDASNGVDVAIFMESVRVVHERLSKYVYGFFLGKRMAYSIVKNYVKIL